MRILLHNELLNLEKKHVEMIKLYLILENVLVEKKLKKRGHNARAIIYKGARHEILNDFTYDEVKNDIIEFIK